MKSLFAIPLCLAFALMTIDAQVSPEILADNRVTFRYTSKEAKEVKAQGQFGEPVSLTKDADGLWTGTTADPVSAGIHEYSLVVDGIRTIDSRNRQLKPQRWPGTSILHIPSDPPALWDWQDGIAHGTVHHHTYRSKVLDGALRGLVVYTPPTMEEPMPVLYLAHGYSDEQGTWTAHGKAHWILDALIASGKAKPMIIVMPDAHAVPPETRDRENWDQYALDNSRAFCEDLMHEVIPLVEAHYPASKDSSMRAFAGLSMGGHHAMTVALQHHTHFSQIGAFSSAPPKDPFMADGLKDAAKINQSLSLFWVACGDNDFLFERNEEAHAAFEKAGLDHAYVVTEGDDHSWPVWRRYLGDFAPKLFKD